MKSRRPRGIVHLASHLLKSRDHAWFITGTDTAVGKTHLVVELLVEFQRRGLPAIGFKPICCGNRNDGLKLHRASSSKDFSLSQINPIHLLHPLAPVAQKCPNWPAILRKIRSSLHTISQSKPRPFILVEGAGGLLCPITKNHTMRDLARTLKLPLIIVALDKLGVLNHTLLTLEATKSLRRSAIVLNHATRQKNISPSSNHTSLKKITKMRVFRIP